MVCYCFVLTFFILLHFYFPFFLIPWILSIYLFWIICFCYFFISTWHSHILFLLSVYSISIPYIGSFFFIFIFYHTWTNIALDNGVSTFWWIHFGHWTFSCGIQYLTFEMIKWKTMKMEIKKSQEKRIFMIHWNRVFFILHDYRKTERKYTLIF